MILATIFCGVFGVIVYFIYQLWKVNQYFKERNVKYKKPNLLFGNTLKSTFKLKHLMDELAESCRAFPDEDIIGFYQTVKPIYVVKNPDLVEKVFIKDFVHFYDHLKFEQKIESPADANLFFLQGNTWRALRQKLTPLFTVGKLRVMYSSITDCLKTFRSVLDKKDGEQVEMFDIISMFSIDVIGLDNCFIHIASN